MSIVCRDESPNRFRLVFAFDCKTRVNCTALLGRTAFPKKDLVFDDKEYDQNEAMRVLGIITFLSCYWRLPEMPKEQCRTSRLSKDLFYK